MNNSNHMEIAKVRNNFRTLQDKDLKEIFDDPIQQLIEKMENEKEDLKNQFLLNIGEVEVELQKDNEKIKELEIGLAKKRGNLHEAW